MPRSKRLDEAGKINRGNAKQDVFHIPEDFHAFLRSFSKGLDKFPVELFAFYLMHIHWHLVLRPRIESGMGKLCEWVSSPRTPRYHAHHQTRGFGHLHQGPFRSFPVQDDNHFRAVCRYVERNVLSANIVKREENCEFGSLLLVHFFDGTTNATESPPCFPVGLSAARPTGSAE